MLREPGSCSEKPGVIMDGDSCVVQIEGHEVARCSSLVEAVLLVAIAIFVFHQKAHRLKNLMWAMCRYVFDVRPETKPTASAKTVMQELVGEGEGNAP